MSKLTPFEKYLVYMSSRAGVILELDDQDKISAFPFFNIQHIKLIVV